MRPGRVAAAAVLAVALALAVALLTVVVTNDSWVGKSTDGLIEHRLEEAKFRIQILSEIRMVFSHTLSL
jgi:hypothetical protein